MNIKCCIGNHQKTLKCMMDTWGFHLRHSSNKPLMMRKREEFRSTQIRCKSTPSEAPPIQKQSIPYVNPNFRPEKGGKLLLLIPAITFGLGTWQVYRLRWKTELIKTMEERTKLEPVPLPLDPEEAAKLEFSKVTVTGCFDHSSEVFYGPKPCFVDGDVKRDVIHPSGRDSFGYNLVTPFIVSDSGERVLVNRGWIRTKAIKKADRPWSNTGGEEMTITGVVRTPEPKRSYGPKTDSRYNIWHYRDIEDIAYQKDCLPIWIDATEEHSIPGKLWGGQTIMTIRNEHLQYSITWYCLSICTAYLWYLRYAKKV